jgi:hypothetical protein
MSYVSEVHASMVRNDLKRAEELNARDFVILYGNFVLSPAP